ncbi:MAG: zinc ribbon domain-containing protein [Bacteroidales bacterium]|jgi:hypothetical protein|nr:zinc ribbon domain-containing protein [Bacteroidales bacterium]
MTLLFLGSLGASEILTLLFLVGFVFLNGRIAKWKGYPFWVGAITGIIGFLGTLIFLLMPFSKKKKKDMKQPENRMNGIKQCSYCGEEIADAAKKCKHCGEWLDKVDE